MTKTIATNEFKLVVQQIVRKTVASKPMITVKILMGIFSQSDGHTLL